MTRMLSTAAIVALVVAAPHAQEKAAPPAMPKLSAELQLKIEVQQLKEQLHQFEIQSAQCSAQLADAQAKLAGSFLTTQQGELQAKRAALDAEVKKALGAKEGDEIDWSTSPPSIKTKPKPAQ